MAIPKQAKIMCPIFRGCDNFEWVIFNLQIEGNAKVTMKVPSAPPIPRIGSIVFERRAKT